MSEHRQQVAQRTAAAIQAHASASGMSHADLDEQVQVMLLDLLHVLLGYDVSPGVVIGKLIASMLSDLVVLDHGQSPLDFTGSPSRESVDAFYQAARIATLDELGLM